MLAVIDPILRDLALLFAVCVVVASVFHRLRMPPVVGFLVVGALAGPNSFRIVTHLELVEQLAEVGVIVLLFTVGLDLSLSHLRQMGRAVTVAGGLQVTGTIALGAGVSLIAGMPFGQAVFVGFLLALSSTAAVMRLLIDRAELGVPAGRIAVGTCIAQDLAVVPMILLVPLLTSGGNFLGAVGDVGKAFGWMVVTLAVAWVVAPRLLDFVAKTRSRELFLLTVFTVCLSVAVVTAMLGLSLALGALLAGVVLAGSDYQHQAQSEVEPFRDSLSSLFFVSIGMLFDFRVILDAPVVVVGALLAVVLGKTAVAFLAVRIMGMPTPTALRTGLMVAQVGEFSFILVRVVGDGVLSEQFEKQLIVVAVLSIALTPLMFGLGKSLAIASRRVDRAAKHRPDQTDHVIIVGFGPVGRSLARTLKALDIQHLVVEMNAATVKKEKAAGVPIMLGDSTRASTLKAAGALRARLLVVAVNDTGAAARTASAARRIAPHIHIIARAMYLTDVTRLRQATCDEVVPQELETSVEITVRALRHFLIADDEVGRQVQEIREHGFGIGKVAPVPKTDSARLDEYAPGLSLHIFRVETGSEVEEKTLAQSDLRSRTGLNVVAIRKGHETVTSIGPDTEVIAGDVVIALGPEERGADAAMLFRGPETGSYDATPV